MHMYDICIYIQTINSIKTTWSWSSVITYLNSQIPVQKFTVVVSREALHHKITPHASEGWAEQAAEHMGDPH